MSKVSPFIKWVGGKSKLLGEYSKIFPSTYNRYFEPFLGGGAVFFGLNKSPSAVISDANTELINAYQCVKKYPQQLSELLEIHQSNYSDSSESYYYSVRDSQPSLELDRAARFIFLNKTCHGGLYRVNKSGKFNVSWGKYKNPAIPTLEALTTASTVLQNAEIINGDFTDVILQAEADDLVFCDPPYIQFVEQEKEPAPQLTLDLGLDLSSPLKNQMFTQYTSDGFSTEKHTQLRDLCLKLSQKGVLVAIANSDCEYTRELYKDFNVHSLEVTHAINRDVEGRQTPVKEILVTNW